MVTSKKPRSRNLRRVSTTKGAHALPVSNIRGMLLMASCVQTLFSQRGGLPRRGRDFGRARRDNRSRNDRGIPSRLFLDQKYERGQFKSIHTRRFFHFTGILIRVAFTGIGRNASRSGPPRRVAHTQRPNYAALKRAARGLVKNLQGTWVKGKPAIAVDAPESKNSQVLTHANIRCHFCLFADSVSVLSVSVSRSPIAGTASAEA